jgi:gliding motility-associated-like protein
MKKNLLLFLVLGSFLCAEARHIKGGFLSYEYVGPGTTNPNNLMYSVTLTVYMDCDAEGLQIDQVVGFTTFNARTFLQVANRQVGISSIRDLNKRFDDPCITGDQAVCFYKVVVYQLENYELPPSTDGYIISYQRCCRIENMENISNSGNVGNTYSITIPGSVSAAENAPINSSPSFEVNDTAVVCANSFFTYSVRATDADGDSLSYEFCPAFNGGSTQIPAPNPSSSPGTYQQIPYNRGYSGTSPLGTRVAIDPVTGLISGIAPPIITIGEYVVTVCVSEYRKGIFFAQTKKELHLSVKDCIPLVAKLAPRGVTCDGFKVDFSNDVPNQTGTTYQWDFDDPASGPANQSNLERPSHTYSDTGRYNVKLKVSSNGGLCADSTTLLIRVYPGFFPAFNIAQTNCIEFPVSFSDRTSTRYGTVNSWRWDFGVAGTLDDTNNIKNPIYTYTSPGFYTIRLIAGSSLGCEDTTETQVEILEKPPFQLTNDTLICIIDTLQLNAIGPGSFLWSPNYFISSLTSPSPLVSPDVPTKYYVTFTNSFGCRNNDSVMVDVKSFVTLDAGNDTTLCRNDGYFLNTQSDGLNYKWDPSIYLSSDTAKRPFATPLAPSITYRVTGSIGKCQSVDFVNIKTIPYPAANAGPDTAVCYRQNAFLSASGGSSYTWSPQLFLSSPGTANTDVVRPTINTKYTVLVTDTLGCPKPATDEVTVEVIPRIIPGAGIRDTSIVLGQELQLSATGGRPGFTYLWEPSLYLDNPNIVNPVSKPEEDITYRITITSDRGNCTGSGTVKIKVFDVQPSFYVPSAFSPNGDGLNDVIKPIALGLKKLTYFRIYNRLGQLIFETSTIGIGWDGTFKGAGQDPANYVWMAEGETYKGEKIKGRGNAVLIR